MRKITVFNYMSVDGFFAGPNGEWEFFGNVSQDPEFNAFAHEGAKSGGGLIFGHTTYELMKSFWPTPDAIKSDPVMAEVLNNSPKIVFLKTLQMVEEGPTGKTLRSCAKFPPQKEEIKEAAKSPGP